jgi:meiotically up-regulated gene 157 (Mug157) protein
MKRADFLKTTGIAAIGTLTGFPILSRAAKQELESLRPAPDKRNFVSEAVEAQINRVKKDIKDAELAWLFENCYPNTLDTTIQFSMMNGKPDTFVITGDIPAMWLRDSAAQVWPYLPLTKKDEKLRQLVEGVIRRQTKCILIDPYANAFNFDDKPVHNPWAGDLTDMKPELHERKWEIDSLCYPVRLAYNYWKTTGDTSVFDADWQRAADLIVQTFTEQQRLEDRGPYKFQRVTTRTNDTQFLGGWGLPTKKVGLIHSMFRPSDDATIYPFLIPSNYFAVASLNQLAEIHQKVTKNEVKAKKAGDLALNVQQALEKHAVMTHPTHGDVVAFEVDGFGNALFMDDSNVPSLLSLPYLDAIPVDSTLYQRTRKFILSDDNPYFHRGEFAEGVGGPHIDVDMIWPMSITMRAMTSTDKQEIKQCLTWLKNTHGGTGFMHESFHKDDPTNFTRKWFAWANTLFGELIVKVHGTAPELLR